MSATMQRNLCALPNRNPIDFLEIDNWLRMNWDCQKTAQSYGYRRLHGYSVYETAVVRRVADRGGVECQSDRRYRFHSMLNQAC